MQQLTTAGQQLQLQLTAAEETVRQLNAGSAALRQQLQGLDTRIGEMTMDGKGVAEELETTLAVVRQLGAAEINLRCQLADAEGQVQQLRESSEMLEGRLQETTAAWEAAEEREAEALNEVSPPRVTFLIKLGVQCLQFVLTITYRANCRPTCNPNHS